MTSTKPPYLIDYRLADVIAAIQILGSYEWASRKIDGWTKKLGKPKSADNWKVVFKQHPEFFRLSENDEWASLRWRHGYDRNYDLAQKKELNEAEIKNLEPEQKENLTRKFLNPNQIESLMKTAIDLHRSTIAQKQEKRWMTPLLFVLLGIILGAVLQAALK